MASPIIAVQEPKECLQQQQQILEKSLPPDYADQDPSIPTPRCSRHSATRMVDNYSSTHHLLKQETYGSKEELAMVNLNHFPSAGELRDTAVGYNSVEKLLPPYPCPPVPHRTSNGVAGGVFENAAPLHARLDNPHSYSYSYSNISDMQAGPDSRHDSTHLSQAHCCPSVSGNHHVHPSLPTHHIATLRRNNTAVHGSLHGDHRLCSERYHVLPPLTDRYHAPPPPRPFHRVSSRESLEDREVSAMFHRDTLLARL